MDDLRPHRRADPDLSLIDFPIIDAHHHLWDLRACRYPWLMARGVRRFFGDPTPIQKNYLVADLLRDAAPLQVEKSVHVQVGVADEDVIEETRWLQRVADSGEGQVLPNAQGLPNAIVAFCDLASEDAAETLRAHLRSRNLRGVRQIIGRAPDEDPGTGSDLLIENRNWQANLRRLVDLDLRFDLQLIPRQVPRIAQVLERIPALRVALCHCGSPWDQSAAGLALWRAGLRRLAALPNIYSKISGFGMFDRHWSASSIKPIIESVVEIFGAQRTMFGSNFPVEKLVSDYATLWGAYDAITATLRADQRQQLFHGTAAEFYALR